MPRSNTYDVTVTIKMTVTGPVTFAGATALATEAVKLSPVTVVDEPGGKVRDIGITNMNVEWRPL